MRLTAACEHRREGRIARRDRQLEEEGQLAVNSGRIRENHGGGVDITRQVFHRRRSSRGGRVGERWEEVVCREKKLIGCCPDRACMESVNIYFVLQYIDIYMQ